MSDGDLNDAHPARTEWWARLVPWTLNGRLVMILGLITAAATIGLGGFLNYSFKSVYFDRLESQLETQARLVGRSLAPDLRANPDPSVIDPLVNAFAEDTEARITIIDERGTVLGDSAGDPATMDNHLDRPEIAEAFTSGMGVTQRES